MDTIIAPSKQSIPTLADQRQAAAAGGVLRFLLRDRTLSALCIPGTRRLRAALENVLHQPDFAEAANEQAGDVDFVPGVGDVGVAGKAVMVVVQSFAERDDRH